MLKGKNFLVTGGAGFIGCNFVRYLLSRYSDIQVVSYDKLTYAGSMDNLANLPNADRHHFVLGDINDAEKVASTLKKYKIDTIVHFAAESHVDNSIAGPQIFVETNVMGTLTLLEQAKKYYEDNKLKSNEFRFHHVSTDEVYGSLELTEPAFTENHNYKPNSPYSASKAGSDHLVRCYYHTYGLPVTISNCSNNYGPYQHREKLIPVVINCCLSNKKIPVYGDGSNIRDWLYVEDHCSAIAAILTKGKVGETYNIGGNNELTNLDLIKNICKIMDKVKPYSNRYESLIEFVTDRKGHDWRYAIDNSKIIADLGWAPNNDFQHMLERMVNHYVC